ncbi:DNA polymerase III subunit beta [Nocardioides sp. Y6]|uniref:Beta sliding clamp n=1 Tax=Nocardioides malaquae TaxID=2773426 RepID=A0ABR9RWI7_9ACTN|nr:DNA polymerase III subunit beta [Nocardioides malaquae]MBE7325957.1 DNA polymerase III subunit beta [Nocardioides malaquae]
MKFRVERDVFADAVAWAARSLPVRPSAPVLAGLLIETGDSGLVLSAFDYETSARAEIRADVEVEGRVLVSGRLLADICRSLPDKPIDFDLAGAKLELKCGSGRFSLQTMPVDEYPSLPAVPPPSGVVTGEEFASAVSQAVTAAGRDDMLPVLTGVRIEIEGERMSLLATDRFRLSHRELTWRPASTDVSLAALVPAKVLSDTAKTLSGEVTISISPAGGDGIIGFEGQGPDGLRRTTTRLLDGDFPKVRSLFPSEHLTVATVDRAELVNTVKRVALVAERNTAVQMKFADSEIVLDSQSGDEAQATEAVDAVITGDEIVTGFNPTYLLDGLTAIGSDKVDLSFTQATKPVVISASDGTDESSFRYLLMPRRLLS